GAGQEGRQQRDRLTRQLLSSFHLLGFLLFVRRRTLGHDIGQHRQRVQIVGPEPKRFFTPFHHFRRVVELLITQDNGLIEGENPLFRLVHEGLKLRRALVEENNVLVFLAEALLFLVG